MSHSRATVALAVVVVVVATASQGVAFLESTTNRHNPPLVDCAPAPAQSTDDGAFRVNLASVLAALPSAAAAALKGFAATRSLGAGGGRAFARGLCFGASANGSSPAAAGDCHACLSAAARDVAGAGGCGSKSRRAGVWRAECFLSYADTNASSAREDAFRGWFYTVPNTTATPDRACTGDRTPADCAWCLEDSARAAAALGWLARIGGEEVAVVGYGCWLRVQISVLPQGPDNKSLRSETFQCLMEMMLAIATLILIKTFVAIMDAVLEPPITHAARDGEFLCASSASMALEDVPVL
ncbi:hypothetical protein ACP70R_019767 [Stipagrostis hirtigluma subsp. patula]